uniref:Uncharacterized protein n=1 Tax=Anguilla anguilla TaxID=7936 RepID=A0A0E9XPI2_ANGAN
MATNFVLALRKKCICNYSSKKKKVKIMDKTGI